MPSKRTRIPLSEPAIGAAERAAVAACMRSGWVSSAGPDIARFENAVAKRLGGHAVAVINGTSALHTALLTAGVGPGDAVLVPALSFVATANTVTYCGARPIFMDVEEASWGMDPVKLGRFLREECRKRGGKTFHKPTGRPIKALVVVHVLGHPADLDPLMTLARDFGLVLIEDACEAIGAEYKGKPVGALGAVGCLSFNGNKIITTGGGGMVLFHKKAWADKARYLSTQARDSALNYFHSQVGYNYRLTNLQSVLGCSQLTRLDQFVTKKRLIYRRYSDAFSGRADITFMPHARWARPTFWLSTLRLLKRGASPDALIQALRAKGIEARRLWHPLHRLPMYRGDRAYRVQVTDRLYQQAVSLPSSVGLSLRQQQTVIREVFHFLRRS